MKIGIEVSTLLNFGAKLGSGRYINNLIHHLLKHKNSAADVVVADVTTGSKLAQYSGENINDEFILTGYYATEKYLPEFENFKMKYPEKSIRFSFYRTTFSQLEKIGQKKFPVIEMLRFKSDILHCPDYIIPPTLNKNIILTIHDMSFFRFPEFNFDWFVKKYQKMVARNARLAKLIIADSESTKKDIIKFLGIESSKIHVVYLASDEIFRILNEEEIDIKVMQRHGIDRNFLLSVGTIEPRKNFKTLIKAFDLLKKNYRFRNLKLVIAGKTGWKSEETFKTFHESKNKEDIILTGEISDSDLVQLYNMASLFVYPSIFEGFGLPVLEAMCCGLPVIASNTSSIPEVLQHPDLLFDPLDEKEICTKISEILSDNNLSTYIRKQCLANSKKFSWSKTAAKTLDIYKLCL